ncbi:triosephosphate isomerase [Desulfobotulus alkaliphilus]|uniref:Triosephosphate isomerase n=1 Tax=Desulfobotulus alkaliphilus TaxID=622671 RepID=A0A562S974_9BACT|nr:triose-phosphate isomerase [Desulfobotulus alkaliphilus]TWI77304.1 triosephosphate isomerase [Desulfobotulus alkaliphilus]
MDRKQLIVANWKMHKTPAEAAEDAAAIATALGRLPDHSSVALAPPFPALVPVRERLAQTQLLLAAQNVHSEAQGAFTGEVSAPMLKACGCDLIIVGHSERRAMANESDAMVQAKMKAAFQHEMGVILCIGESDSQRNEGQTFKVLDKQVREAVKGLSVTGVNSLVLAYEPIWAIGTGKTASVDQVQEVHAFLRETLADCFQTGLEKDLAKQTEILYGGSVKPSNIKDLMSMKDVDGALVGGASLNPETFVSLIRNGFDL